VDLVRSEKRGHATWWEVATGGEGRINSGRRSCYDIAVGFAVIEERRKARELERGRVCHVVFLFGS